MIKDFQTLPASPAGAQPTPGPSKDTLKTPRGKTARPKIASTPRSYQPLTGTTSYKQGPILIELLVETSTPETPSRHTPVPDTRDKEATSAISAALDIEIRARPKTRT
ncbi:hypothetical protein N7454_001889 [Penicillium verhagenii]|nr:hypothetical protein N7454_001889 [Penicillium verhagenii]